MLKVTFLPIVLCLSVSNGCASNQQSLKAESGVMDNHNTTSFSASFVGEVPQEKKVHLVFEGIVFDDEHGALDVACHMDGGIGGDGVAIGSNTVGLHPCVDASEQHRLNQSYSVLCADAPPSLAKVVFIQGKDDGNGVSGPWLEGALSPQPTQPICLARPERDDPWKGVRLRQLTSSPLQPALSNNARRDILLSIGTELELHCEGGCEGEGLKEGKVGGVGSEIDDCAKEAQELVGSSSLELFAARLPHPSVGLALLQGPRFRFWLNNGFSPEAGQRIQVLASIDKDGGVVEFIYMGLSTKVVHGIGDLDGDGYEDILIDGRGGEWSPPWGKVYLKRWKKGPSGWSWPAQEFMGE